ncbi:MAG TPA: carboxypeptidase regulatory-like domain-containing protein [Longimicrobiaceae bacterium]|nr:carboxypeptidase regulatory-like domain-containing protein [Longimicrobiaceae bacterium]
MRNTLPLLALVLGLAAGALPARAQGNIELPRARPRRVPPAVLLVHVVDEKGAPMQGAYVTVGGMDHGASTDREGQAKLSVTPGGRLVVVSRQGYAFHRGPADFVSGDTVRQEVALTPAPVELEGITVTTWGRSMNLVRNGFYDRQRRGLGAFMTRQRLDEIRPFRTADAFRYMRGFMVRPSGMQDIVTTTRGPVSLHGGCVPSVYIDGMRMFIREARDQADALNMVWPDDIEAIEAYQGPASIPAEYNPMGTACGVILIWTRR